MSLVALAGYTVCLLALAMLHFLRRDYSPIQHDLSEYVAGSYGGIMTIAFLGMSAGTFALAAGLYYSRLKASLSAIALLALFASGVLAAGIFATDLPGEPSTLRGIIHGLASMVGFISGMAAFVLITARMQEDRQWQVIYRPAAALALLGPVMFLLWIIIFGPLGLSGLGQRTVVAILMTWLVLVANHLRKTAVELRNVSQKRIV